MSLESITDPDLRASVSVLWEIAMITRRNFLKKLPFFGVLPLVYNIPCKAVVERPKRSLIGQLTLNLEQEFGEVAEANSAWLPNEFVPALYEHGEDGRHFPELGCWPPGVGVFPHFEAKAEATYYLFGTINRFINRCLTNLNLSRRDCALIWRERPEVGESYSFDVTWDAYSGHSGEYKFKKRSDGVQYSGYARLAVVPMFKTTDKRPGG